MNHIKKRLEERNNQFSLQFLLQATITIGMIILVSIVVIDLVSDFGDDFATGTAEKNASDAGIAALGKIPAKSGTLVNAIVGVVIIGLLILLVGGIYQRSGRGGGAI